MTTLQFKTNINCSGCIEKVTPFMAQIPQLDSWQVDTQNPHKILTVTCGEGQKINELVTAKVKEAGFLISPIVSVG